MITATKLGELIAYTIWAHTEFPTKPSKAVRKWDAKTPYSVHPIWCAMTIMSEHLLPEEFRVIGAEALLFHDILEDTTALLPNDTQPEVVHLVEEMTFASNAEEMELVWTRSKEARLLKIYDKTSNLLDDSWMPKEKRDRYAAYLLRLCDEAEPYFGRLNIIRIARAIA